MAITKLPMASCVRRLPMKLRMIRGPSWLTVSVSTTMVIETTKAAMLIIEDSSVASSWRASSGLPE